MMSTFADPLSPQEVDDVADRLTMEALAALVVVDPDAATKVLKAKRERGD